MEIERKFLFDELPGDAGSEQRIEQGYLAITNDGTEVRVRRWPDGQVLTVKHGTGEVRIEVELSLDEEQFSELWPLTEGRRVTKTRWHAPIGDLEWDLDVFEVRSRAQDRRGRVPGRGGGRSVRASRLDRPRGNRGPALRERASRDRRHPRLSNPFHRSLSGKPRRMSSTPRKYRFRDGHPLDQEIVRAAAGRTDHALEALTDDLAKEPETAVHTARKDLKKLRSLLRLVRTGLGDEAYSAANDSAAGQALGGIAMPTSCSRRSKR